MTTRHFETYARPAAAFLLVVGCFLVLQPFITALLFAVVIAVSTVLIIGIQESAKVNSVIVMNTQ